VANHDHGYKKLFSHPEMVEDLLREFVHEDWVTRLDFSTLEKVPSTFLSRKKMLKRESDVIWRLRWQGEEDRWLYVYLLLEFQSKVEPFMAVRMMTYLGLFYESLIRQHHLTPEGRLPPVLPLVLYNGNVRWGAAQDVSELVETVPGLKRYQPQLRYCLLDSGRIAVSELEALQSLAAMLFRLERSRGPEDLLTIFPELLRSLEDPALAELRQAFATLLREVLLPARIPGVEIPEMADLQEVNVMLAENVVEWTREWERKGLEKGLQEGRQKGLQEGLEEGLQKGLQEGLEEGLQKGLQEGRQEGIEQTISALRRVLLAKLEERFGALPDAVRQRVESLGSIEELAELVSRQATAPSLVSLGLT
jgi:predicted transposase YdaD